MSFHTRWRLEQLYRFLLIILTLLLEYDEVLADMDELGKSS